MNKILQGDFQICISVPLMSKYSIKKAKFWTFIVDMCVKGCHYTVI